MNTTPRSGLKLGALVLLGVAVLFGIALAVRQLIFPVSVQPIEQTEKELVDFMLTRMELEPGGEQLIVYTAKKPTASEQYNDYTDPDRPLRAWVYKDGKLVESVDQPDLRQVVKDYVGDFSTLKPTRSISYFTIVSISPDGKSAKIVVDHSCGPLCGEGVLYTLERNSPGQWEITDSQGTWIS